MKKENKNQEVDLKAIRQALDMAETQIRLARKLLFSGIYEEKAAGLKLEEGRIVEGVFDGEGMMGADGKRYPVPANYASKSKLVPGDKLKLTIADDGSFLFKQIGPVDRKRVIGKLEESNEEYFVTVDGKNYRVLPASVTYFKAKVGEKVTLIVPREQESEWGAMENIVP